MKFKLETNENKYGEFFFRIASEDGSVCGDWTHYAGIAALKHDGELYIAVTNYFAGEIPGETVLKVSPA